jgi:acyl-CoA reductase-like NAD-dependent aldehyde dehydrogenase
MTIQQKPPRGDAVADQTLRTKMVIGGEQVDAADGRTFDVVNPATGKVIATAPQGGKEDVDRAVAAASKARQLQQETADAEQKRYQLGASTVYQVILTQRDLLSAEGTELRALANLVEAKANYERAVGRTLEVNHVNIADAKSGEVERDTLIPGTLHGQVVGVDKLFPASDAGQK